MPLETQRATLAVLREALPDHELVEKPPTPLWLRRPGRPECGHQWALISRIYTALTGAELSEVMPPRERRALDAVLIAPDGTHRVVEIDETQHFNQFRALTLELYPAGARLAFDRQEWIARSRAKQRLEGGGFGKPRPPLFPGEHGRHRQRAFRDTLADLLPLEYGWGPTLRIHDQQVRGWLHDEGASTRMRTLLQERLR